ncbi:response regulator [Massilia sp. MS-15]|uniref:hybrid sensor histidine kinase/response regulator n=1 Tax=Massilia sp. MS-15 TaxID=2878200 RepID=UPI001CD5B748|nr:response regulator [Massilia sp. MS-15]MCA1248375.1 response regulator [Massilia sp. MS-15]
MPTFARSSLNQKLTTISLFSTATALVFVFTVLAAASVASQRRDAAAQLSALAEVIAAGSADHLLLRDRPRAQAALAALAGKRDISAAALYDRHGQVFAQYRAGASNRPISPVLDGIDGAALAAANAAGQHLLARHLRVYQLVASPGLQVGVVMIETDLAGAWTEIVAGLALMALAMGVALVVAVAMAGRFTRSIAEPVSRLIGTARQVSASQDYSLRIAHTRSDELGQLIDSFNTMLAQIEDRGAALLQHRDELERQVGVRTAQLEKAKNAAEAASRAKSAFLATMSHEIRTPMNGVLGMTDMLLATGLTEVQRNYASLVKRSGEHLLVIINDILDFSKIEAGKLAIEYLNFNLWDLLDELHKVYAPQAAAKDIGFDFDIASDIPVAICGDPNRLRQVLANLLGNAVKFTGQGRIQVRVRVTREDAQQVTLRFEVHDTGIGIARAARAHLFEAFAQADASTTRRYGGTGLGLAISRQLVELMGGAIGADSAPEQGAVFWFTLGFDKRRVHPDAAHAPGQRPRPLAGLRVLVVDEHEHSRTELLGQLQGWGASAHGAASAVLGHDSLLGAARAGQPYDAAVIDMELRDTSGLALAASLRSDLPAGLHPPTRLVLLSPGRLAADPVQRRMAGVAYQLVKPARAADLVACLTAGATRSPLPPAAPAGIAAAADPRPAGPGRAPRVLLAEDNPVNVEVAKAMLENFGLEAHCAGNGQEALDALRAGGFDAVLMDCQMPVMDGFAATAAIRRQEREAGHAAPLPVIALTANALQGDRGACLAAGMDDYLSKPFTRQQLAAVLGRWVALPLASPPAELAPHPARDAGAGPAPRCAAVSRAALDNIRALSCDAGADLVQKVVQAYLAEAPRQLAALRQALGGPDAALLRRLAHSLKSASANVGALRLAALCREFELLGRAGTEAGQAAILAVLADMEREFQAVRTALHAMLEKET